MVTLVSGGDHRGPTPNNERNSSDPSDHADQSSNRGTASSSARKSFVFNNLQVGAATARPHMSRYGAAGGTKSHPLSHNKTQTANSMHIRYFLVSFTGTSRTGMPARGAARPIRSATAGVRNSAMWRKSSVRAHRDRNAHPIAVVA